MPDKRNGSAGLTQASTSAPDDSPASGSCVRPSSGPKPDYFPNVVLVTHENRKALFYDDLLKGKTVLINFMCIKDDPLYRMTGNLAKVQPFLGERLGRDVFMYSITVDPENDGPRRLEAFAEKHGARPGWLFLTGNPAAIQRVRDSFFARGAGHDHSSGPHEDCSMGLIRYGNEAAGLWGSVPGSTDPEWIAHRLSWVQTRDRPKGDFRRRGPAPLIAGNSRA